MKKINERKEDLYLWYLIQKDIFIDTFIQDIGLKKSKSEEYMCRLTRWTFKKVLEGLKLIIATNQVAKFFL